MDEPKQIKLFDFPAATKSDWLRQIEKEIQPKLWSDLRIAIGENGGVDAAYHPEDHIISRVVHNSAVNNDWLIAEDFDAAMSAKILNKRIIIALEYGLQSPVIRDFENASQLAVLLNGVIPGYIQICWERPKLEDAVLISQQLRKMHTEPGNMGGAFLPVLTLDTTFDRDLSMIASNFTQSYTPDYRWIHIAASDNNQNEPFSDELGFLCFAFHKCLEKLDDSGQLSEEIISRFQISINAGDQLLPEIARIRALRILLGNIQKMHGLSGQSPVFIAGRTDLSSYFTDADTNRIKAALIGWALATGGVDSMNIAGGNLHPPDSEWSFNSRIARNISHLLKMESFLAEVKDPAAGAYFIEEMTNQLVADTWTQLQAKESIHNIITLS